MPRVPNGKPPIEGARMRVRLSMDADNPKVPPISWGYTDLVNVLLRTVFRVPPAKARGAITSNNTGTLRVKAQPNRPTVMISELLKIN